MNSVSGRVQFHSNRRSAVSAETRVLCQRFEMKNQRGLCEICGEEPGRSVWGFWWRTGEACVRFVAKNQRGLCEVCGEEPERLVWGLWRRTREACVRFVEKNQRGLCEVCGEEPEGLVWGSWKRTREACVRFVSNTLAMRQVSVRIRRFSAAYYHFSYSPYPFIRHPPDGQWPS